MVPKASGAVGSGTNNGYDEYMLIVSGSTKKFEKIGDSAVDLTNYADKSLCRPIRSRCFICC